MIGDYATPQAFRSALEARLRLMAQQRGIDLRRLYRWVAFERLLARLFAPTSPPWVLKGGYALEVCVKRQLELDIGVGTVKWYLTNLYDKLDMGNRTQAVARVRELGLLA